MSDEPKKALSPEEITALLKKAARKRRPWTPLSVLICLLVFGVPLALLLWWVWPRPAPPRFRVLTFDAVAGSGEAVTLRARLEPVDEESAGASLEGRELHFVEAGPMRQAGQKTWQATALTEPDGSAAVEWQSPAGVSSVEFVVRYVSGKTFADDQGRVFLWPVDAPLLVVDVESALASFPLIPSQKRSLADIPRNPEAAVALQAVQAKGYRIVYLALEAEQPLAYRHARDWIRLQLRPSPTAKPLPDGPVLGRPAYGAGASVAHARQEVLAALKKRFRGPMVGVSGRAAAAEAARDAGLTAFLVAAGEAPPGVTRVQRWPDLPERLQGSLK